jgi:S1-C subfamily serine protease
MTASTTGPAGSALAGLSRDLAATVELAGRSVVAINARRRIPSSGVVWQGGIVVTASHTITRDDDITVTLGSGRSVQATLAGRDPSTDLAVLKLEDAAVPAVERAGDGDLQVGRLVLAVGRPGPQLTASLGIVSAVGGEWRTWQGGRIDRFVRLDLSIYDGFSGGALVEAGGRVLGINTSGLARATALTIPATTVDRLTTQLLSSGSVSRGFLGLAVQPVLLPDALQTRLGIEHRGGLVVVNLETDGPADRAGILLGDIIVALEDDPVSDPADLLAALGPDRVGRPAAVRVVRAGELATVPVTVAERPTRRGRRG